MSPSSGRPYRYGVYGVTISSDMPLALPQYAHAALGRIECVSAARSHFAAALDGVVFSSPPESWYQYAFLDDGSTYVRWSNVGEFLVDGDGHGVVCRREPGASSESFEVYLFGQALSFALVRQRFEPLHATAVAVEGQAVAFLGGNAFGKSSLAASFFAAGYPLITDDLLLPHVTPGATIVYPGPPRIKLFSKTARRILDGDAPGIPMHGNTTKMILPVDESRHCAVPVPLRCIYVLAPPRAAGRGPDVVVERLTAREAFLSLVRWTFNRRLVDARRLASQFALASTIAAAIPVKRLTYPRALERLDDVRRKVLADLAGERA
ncbi:MAG: hypothetical protein ACRD1V_07545 [Vicinamibacterales bacterium]